MEMNRANRLAPIEQIENEAEVKTYTIGLLFAKRINASGNQPHDEGHGKSNLEISAGPLPRGGATPANSLRQVRVNSLSFGRLSNFSIKVKRYQL